MVADDLSIADVRLTPTERRLWEILRGEPGRIFSRKELVTLAIPGAIVLHRTIDVHIRGLRKKLGERAANLRTVRQIGYSWADTGNG